MFSLESWDVAQLNCVWTYCCLCCSAGPVDTQRLTEMASQCRRDLDKQMDVLQELKDKVWPLSASTLILRHTFLFSATLHSIRPIPISSRNLVFSSSYPLFCYFPSVDIFFKSCCSQYVAFSNLSGFQWIWFDLFVTSLLVMWSSIGFWTFFDRQHF